MRAVLWLLMLIVVPAVASEREPGSIEVNVWGLSTHHEGAPRGRAWNETNPGVGLRWNFASPIEMKGLETFVTVDFIAQNSTRGKLFMAGVGAQYPIASFGAAKLYLGAAAGFQSYENRWERATHNLPGGYPFLALRYCGTTLTVGHVPKVRAFGLESYPATFAYLSFPLTGKVNWSCASAP